MSHFIASIPVVRGPIFRRWPGDTVATDSAVSHTTFYQANGSQLVTFRIVAGRSSLEYKVLYLSLVIFAILSIATTQISEKKVFADENNNTKWRKLSINKAPAAQLDLDLSKFDFWSDFPVGTIGDFFIKSNVLALLKFCFQAELPTP